METEIEIIELAKGGAGFGRINGKACFVHGGFPADRLRIRTTTDKKDFCEADIMEILSPSPHRREPECAYVNDCGGCPWMPIAPAFQLEVKQMQVKQQFQRIAKMEPPDITVNATSSTLGYRHRIRLQYQIDENGLQLGYHRRRTNTIVDVHPCVIAHPLLNHAMEDLRKSLPTQILKGSGELMLETGYPVNGVRGTFITKDHIDRHQLEAIRAICPDITGLGIDSGNSLFLNGNNSLSMEVAEGLSLTFGPRVFSQINPVANRKMVAKVIALAGPGKGKALDLYCGIGNFSIPLAKAGWKVTGIEISTGAVKDGQKNGSRLGFEIDFINADALHGTRTLAKQGAQFDLVILDPARAGAKGVARWIAETGTKKVIYVSCDPSTLARDTAELSKAGFKLDTVSITDMFPHTAHVETIATFTRN